MAETLIEIINKIRKTGNREIIENNFGIIMKDMLYRNIYYDHIFVGDMFVSVFGNTNINHDFLSDYTKYYIMKEHDIIDNSKINKIYRIQHIIYSSIGFELFRLYMSIPEYNRYINNMLISQTRLKDIKNTYDDDNKMILPLDICHHIMSNRGTEYKKVINMLQYKKIKNNKMSIANITKDIKEDVYDELLLLSFNTFLSDIEDKGNKTEYKFVINPHAFNTIKYIKDIEEKHILIIMYILFLSKIYYFDAKFDDIVKTSYNTFNIIKDNNRNIKDSKIRKNRIFMQYMFDDNTILKNMYKTTIKGVLGKMNIFTNDMLFNNKDVYKDIYLYNEFYIDPTEEPIKTFDDIRIYKI